MHPSYEGWPFHLFVEEQRRGHVLRQDGRHWAQVLWLGGRISWAAEVKWGDGHQFPLQLVTRRHSDTGHYHQTLKPNH